MITCVASRGSTSFLIPPADSAAHAGIAQVIATAAAVSTPSATTSHSPARDTESDAAAANRAIHDLGGIEARLARAVGAQKRNMHRGRAMLDMFDEPDHRRQRDAARVWAPRMKAEACLRFGPKIAEHDSATGEISLNGAAFWRLRLAPDRERSRGPVGGASGIGGP
jgi:hypothetical protein